MKAATVFYALVFSLLTLSCDNSKVDVIAPTQGTVPVIATEAKSRSVTKSIHSIGTLAPSSFVEIKPQVSGTLTKVIAKEGEWVQEGTFLFEIDPTRYEIQLQEAHAQLSMDRAVLEAVEKKLARFSVLSEKELISKTEIEELIAQREKLASTVEIDLAKLKKCQLELDDCFINSPIEGFVGRIEVHRGQFINNDPTNSLTTITKIDPLFVQFSITESEFLQIPENLQEVLIESLSNRTGEAGELSQAFVSFLSHTFEHKTGLMFVRAKLENSKLKWRPGMAVGIHIPVAIILNAVVIPQKAVRYNQTGPYVYVVENDNRVSVRQILLGDEVDQEVMVLEGLSEKELIILEGHLRLIPGTLVEVKNDQPL